MYGSDLQAFRILDIFSEADLKELIAQASAENGLGGSHTLERIGTSRFVDTGTAMLLAITAVATDFVRARLVAAGFTLAEGLGAYEQLQVVASACGVEATEWTPTPVLLARVQAWADMRRTGTPAATIASEPVELRFAQWKKVLDLEETATRDRLMEMGRARRRGIWLVDPSKLSPRERERAMALATR